MTVARVLRRSADRRLTSALIATALVVSGLLAIATADGTPPARLGLLQGAAWLPSTAVGTLTLVDGHSVEVAARVRVASPDAGILAVQDGPAGWSVDAATSEVARVDPGRLQPAPPLVSIPEPGGDVTAYPSDGGVYVVDAEGGRVARTDGRGPRPRAVSLGEPVAASAVDSRSRLWLLGRSGQLRRLDGGTSHDNLGSVAHGDDVTLVTVDGTVALIDRVDRTVTLVDGDRPGRAVPCPLGRNDPTERTAGMTDRSLLVTASPVDGALHVAEVTASGCDVGAVPLPGTTGHALGTPVLADGHAYVADATAGVVHVIDIEAGEAREAVTTERLLAEGTPFDIVAHDGIAFYNDPASHRAGVVHPDGTFTPVEKYATAVPPPADVAAPAPAQRMDEPPPEGTLEESPPRLPPPTSPAPPLPATAGGQVPQRGTRDPDPDVPDSPAGPDSPDRPAGPVPRSPSDGDDDGPTTSDIRYEAADYTVGDTLLLSADITSTFVGCRWTVGTVTTDCSRTSGDGPVTITGEVRLTTHGSVPVGLEVTGPGGAITRREGVVQVGQELTASAPYVVTEPDEFGGWEYYVGQDIEVAAELSGRYSACTWRIGEVTTPCDPPSSDGGAVTARATLTLAEHGNTTIELLVDGLPPATLSVYAGDPTGPSVDVWEAEFFRAGPSRLGYRVEIVASDPESNVTSIDLGTTFGWQCEGDPGPPDLPPGNTSGFSFTSAGEPIDETQYFDLPCTGPVNIYWDAQLIVDNEGESHGEVELGDFGEVQV